MVGIALVILVTFDLIIWGAWVALSVKHLTVGFGSGYGLSAHEFKPHIRL